MKPLQADLHESFKRRRDAAGMHDAVLIVSPDCRLCDRARSLLRRLGIAFREIDLADDEAAELARNGVPVVLFPVLVDGTRVVAYGDIREDEVRRAMAPGAAG